MWRPRLASGKTGVWNTKKKAAALGFNLLRQPLFYRLDCVTQSWIVCAVQV